MVELDSSIRLVGLQFSFSNPDAIPPTARRLERETLEERDERKSHSSGLLVIEPTGNCSLVEFLGELEKAGYEMVDALYKERLKPQGGKAYHMVRFLFARHGFANPSEEFEEARDTIRAELEEMVRVAMWRVRVFLNPFFDNGEEKIGQYAVSVNLEVRTPLLLPDGQPVTMWKRDDDGRRVGNAPLPIAPKHHLRLLDNTVHLVAAGDGN